MNYRAIPGVNWSSLSRMAKSPLHYQHHISLSSEPTAAMFLGIATHCAILEPDEWATRYVIWDGGPKRGKVWGGFYEQHQDRAILSTDEAAMVLGAAAAVRRNQAARELLDGAEVERTITWTDERTGLPCKGRVDAWNDGHVIDIKTCRTVEPRLFAQSAARYGYHGQIAFYHDGSGATEPPVFIAVESKPPHDVAVYLCDLLLIPGRALYRRLLDRLAECQASGQWPGVVPSPMELQLPAWAEGGEDNDGLDWGDA